VTPVQTSDAFARPGPSIPQRIGSHVARRWRRDLVFFLIAATVVAADQWTKWLVRENVAYLTTGWEFGPVRIIHVVNSGAAFGILQGETPFLIVMSLFGLAAIVLYYVYPPMDHGVIRIALGLQLGGAVGNLIDRVRLGEVTDFIDVGEFPTFNIADSCITVSIIVVLGFFALQEFEQERHGPGGGVANNAKADGGGRRKDPPSSILPPPSPAERERSPLRDADLDDD
jgi:signal peptidase II